MAEELMDLDTEKKVENHGSRAWMTQTARWYHHHHRPTTALAVVVHRKPERPLKVVNIPVRPQKYLKSKSPNVCFLIQTCCGAQTISCQGPLENYTYLTADAHLILFYSWEPHLAEAKDLN